MLRLVCLMQFGGCGADCVMRVIAVLGIAGDRAKFPVPACSTVIVPH
jgi:hypothetical protein